jgi:CHAD domain-containing protein
VVAGHGAAYDQSVAGSPLERERKLLGDHEMLAGLDGVPLDTRVFTSTYFDTNDRRLLRRGVTLRRRVENGRSRWRLKLPQPAGRLEIEADGGPIPPPELYELLTAFLGGRKLAPAATLRTRRRGVRVTNGNGAADVVADEVCILEGSRQVDTFDELEVELVRGDESLLDALEVRLHEAGARPATGEIKLERVLGPPPRIVNEAPAHDAPPLEHLLFQLRTQYEAIVRHDPGVRLGADPEEVHDLRVAVRRLRAMLRAARPMLAPEWSEPLRSELRWLAGELGPLRDADVFVAYLRAEAARLEESDGAGMEQLEALVEEDRETAHARAVAALRSARYLSLLRELERTARAPRVRSAGAELEGIAAAEFRKLRKAARRIHSSSSDEELHALRIRGKRARYAAELAATAVGKRARKFLKAAKSFQDVVGEHQDAVVAEEHLRRLQARGGREAAFVAGRLVERQRDRRRQARHRLAGAWKRLDRAGTRAWR